MVLYTLQMKEHQQVSHESISIHYGLKIPHNFRDLTKMYCKFPQDKHKIVLHGTDSTTTRYII